MAQYRGFAGEVSEMSGIINAQGNYNQGRGPDGLSAFVGSRFGMAVRRSGRPPAISGKPPPAPGLDPNVLLPRLPRMGGPIDPNGVTIPGTVKFTTISTPPVRMMKPRRARPRKPNKAAQIRHRQAFLNWIKGWAPQLYLQAKKRADQSEASDATLGQLAGWWETFSENLTDIGGKVLQYKTQKEILDAQLERMRAGLPPLQTSEYAPTIGVKVDPGTTREITGAIGAGFGKMLPFIAIAGVVMLFVMRRPARR